MEKVRINVAGGYDVSIGPGLIGSCGGIAASVLAPCRVAVITGENVAKLYLPAVMDSLGRAGFEPRCFVHPSGEGGKTMATLTDILEFMASAGLCRSDMALALGGGVTGDLTGFAAGCYMRGIAYVMLPTTLLSAVDSSVGGKTAVDLPSGKNLAGLFNQPRAVICDTACLDTLPSRELDCGMAEVVKTAVLAGGELMELLERGEAMERRDELVSRCVRYKAGVVERDERERGERKMLNLGHTAGHAIESLSGCTLTHGHAVAAGLAIITRASAALGWCGADTAERILGLLNKYALPIFAPYTPKQLARAARADKKRSGDDITLAIPSAIGGCSLKTVALSELEGIFAAGAERAL